MRRLFGPFFVLAGVLHFAIPDTYEAIVPEYLPARRALVYASGVAEVAGGAAVMHPRTRRLGGLVSIATLLGVFPANVHMALHPERYRRKVPQKDTPLRRVGRSGAAQRFRWMAAR